MNYTKNYRLLKPELSDFLNPSYMNDNADVLDEKIKELYEANNKILNEQLPQFLKIWVASADNIRSVGNYFCLGSANLPTNYTMGIILFENSGTWPGQNWPKDIQTFSGFDGSLWRRNTLRVAQYGWAPWQKIL